MYTLLSLVTSVKDYVEVVHKLIETDPNWNLTTYYDFGATTTFVILSLKQMIANFLSLNWFQTIWSLPTLVPDMAASMISEISVLDGSFHNTLTFLETPLSYGNTNLLFYCLEKFMIGFVNSLFLCFPTSIAHIITLRRFVMQGLEAGYISGLGTIAGNLLWIGSIVFGLRFIVIPWLSLDILRYLLGFLLLVKYMWDSYTERRTVLEDLSKWKIFLLTFLLSFTEQTNLSPFLSNLSIGSDATPFESFPTQTLFEFVMVHGCYLMGIFVGSFSLLQLTCWFWENPAFNLYMWFLSSFKVTTSFYHKLLNLTFLYITMICAVSNMAYFGIDYTITNPLGMVHEDRLVDQKMLLETAFFNSKASDRNTRRNRGRHGRRERWKRRVRRYRTFDASLYDQGVYDLFTIEDLNYGFDRFWLRRKIRNHRVRFRFFPGPWMRSFKKQLSRPRLESFMGPRVEFFRILFEQAYHPEFHEFRNKKKGIASADKTNNTTLQTPNQTFEAMNQKKRILSVYADSLSLTNSKNQLRTGETSSLIEDLRKEKSALRKFVRKVNSRIQLAKIRNEIETMFGSSVFDGLNPSGKVNSAVPSFSSFPFSSKKEQKGGLRPKEDLQNSTKPIYSKRWKYLFSKMAYGQADMPNPYTKSDDHLFQRFSKNVLWKNEKLPSNLQNYFEPSSNDLVPFMNAGTSMVQSSNQNNKESHFTKKEDVKKHLSKKDRQILRYKTFLTNGQEGMESVDVDSRGTSFYSFFEEKGKGKQKEELKKNTKEDMYRPMTLLHPIKFYLQKEQAFQRKLSFYGVKPFRNYGVENNAPYFRIMMKRFFYYYKPTLRWERTMRVATLRKARRKGPRVPRKPNVTKTTEALSLMSNPASVNSDPALSSNVSSSLIQKPTHFYSLVSKRASRYRFQIYKDVLQHWYYTPLNRLLLKFDVDSFIRRQPQTYFLNKKDEKFLHLKRTLLSEYYETLRWYTYMQHARTMKANIGGTKSLSSRAYNQQFQGTFKKIRHLFAITPSSTDYTVLKFDQPLYNEYSNDRNDSIVEDSVVHEELLADETIYMNPLTNLDNMRKTPEDLPNQSAKILREYLFTSAPLRQELIQKLLSEKNYWELTQFLFKGQKLRGTRPITNSTDFFNQEQSYLLPSDSSMVNNSVNIPSKQELWIALLKKAQNTLYDQESLKNYVSGRVEKHEKQKQRQEKQLKERLERMKQWFVEKKINNSNIQTKDVEQAYTSNYSGLTSSIQKALKDGFFWEKGWTSPKFNIRNNRPNFYQHLDAETQGSLAYNLGTFPSSKSIFLKDHLKNRVKQHALQRKKAEQDLKNQFASIQQNMAGSSEKVQTQFQSVKKQWKRIQHLFLKPFQPIFLKSSSLIKGWIGMGEVPGQNSITSNNLKTQPQKDLSFWRQREMALSKRKKIRKTLKRLRNATNRKETTWISSKNEPEDFINYSLLPFSSKKEQKENKGDRKKLDLLPNGNDSNREVLSNFDTISNTKNQKDWQRFLGSFNSSSYPKEKSRADALAKGVTSADKTSRFQQLFMKSLKRKRTRLRRSRRFKARSPIKKSTLGEKFKRQFRLLKKYRQTDNLGTVEFQAKQNRKVEIIQQITKRKYDPQSEFQRNETKQRRTRQRKHRFWKKHKKQKYATNRRKLRHQRRRYALNKIRALNKKLYRIEGNAQMKQWWWQTFLPNFQANKDALWQIQKNQQIQQQLSQLSVSEILERDQAFAKLSRVPSGTIENPEKAQALQIGDKDYKPLAIPEALRIREQLVQKQLLNFGSDLTSFQTNQGQNTVSSFPSEKQEATNKTEQNAQSLELKGESAFASNSSDLIGQLSQSASSIPLEQTEKRMVGSIPFSVKNQENNRDTSKTQTFQNFYEQDSSKFMVGTNPMPFYAGWDETLRKFVVTNRFLSRKEAGYLMNPSFSNSLLSSNNEVKAPLQGMNAATTLYWQIPFTTYDPDQFFALGMDGFSPIAWNNFHFKHSKQTTKPILVKNILSNLNSSNRSFAFSKNTEDLQYKILSSRFKPKTQQNQEFNTFKIHQYRRIQKRQKRLKKHPRPPVWFPSGPLTNQVLPVHYIYVFYKRSRLPRDRYIRRRLRRTPHVDIDQQSQLANQVFKNADTQALRFDAAYDLSTIKDYTLRKRAKPRRKYHRTRQKTNPDTFFLKRRAFRAVQFYDTNTDTLNNDLLPIKNEHSLRFRPLSKIQATSVLSSKRTAFKSKTSASFFDEKRNRDKEGTRKSAKQSSENLRVRQLRRRVQRQVLRPISRYKPRAGGFVWPGDYLRFELVKAPKLQTFTSKLPLTEPSTSSVSVNTVGQSPEALVSTETSSKSRKIRKKKRRTIQEWQIQPKQYLLQKHNRKVLKKRLEKSQNLAQMHQKVQQFQYLWNN